jgi:hypothetical protein
MPMVAGVNVIYLKIMLIFTKLKRIVALFACIGGFWTVTLKGLKLMYTFKKEGRRSTNLQSVSLIFHVLSISKFKFLFLILFVEENTNVNELVALLFEFLL